MLDGLHCRLERHDRLEPQILGEAAVAVQQQARPYHVEVGLRITRRGARVRAMAQAELLAPPLFDGVDDAHEQLELVLRVRERLFVVFVGHGEVREDALGVDARHLAVLDDALHAAFEEVALAQVAQARHAGIHLYVHFQRFTELHGFVRVVDGLRLARDRLRDVVLDELLHLIARRVAQYEHGHGDAVLAQLHSLVDAAHGQVVGAAFLQAAAHLHRSVPIGVGFHDTQKLHVVADVALQRLVVARQGVQVDFGPGPLQIRCHVRRPSLSKPLAR